jgi:hypothetical protein
MLKIRFWNVKLILEIYISSQELHISQEDFLRPESNFKIKLRNKTSGHYYSNFGKEINK